MKRFVIVRLVLLVLIAGAASAQRATSTVVLIVSDGLRWQEVMTGADSTLLGEHGGNWESTADLTKKFWNYDVAKRRAMLLPFFWGVVAKQGQVFGDRSRGNIARVTNGLGFSYPGYNEMLTGRADPRINSNEFGPNPDTTVFEWLNGMKAYQGRVGVYATWNTFKDIFNIPRSHIAIQAGWDLPAHPRNTPRDALLDSLFQITTKLDDTDLTNSFLQIALIDYVRAGGPRVLFVGYGETDNWAHSGRYDLVLESAHQMDAFVRQLWETMQSMREYKGHTTFIITADHGRGSGLEAWKHHGKEYPGSEDIWIGVIGPDTPALGPRSGPPIITQSQIAATIATLLGQDYRKFSPLAAAPLPVLIPTPTSACAAATGLSDGVGYNIREIISSTDTATARYRGLLGLPQMASSALEVVTAPSICTRLVTAYGAARESPAMRGQLVVWRLGNYYAAFDPFRVPGTGAVVFFRSDWTYLNMMPTDY